jgi:adenosylhomocysteine nucleosidase
LALSAAGIVCALAAEARHLGPLNAGRSIESLPDGTLFSVTGMGGLAAARGAEALLAAGAGALASFGLAGGLDPALHAGAVLLPDEVIGPNGQRLVTSTGWRDRLVAALQPHQLASTGRLLTMPRAVGSVTDKAELFRSTGAAAVDMESLAVAEVAARHQVPFVAVRVVVDSAGDVLPNAVSAAADKEGHLQIWRLMGALALAPGELAPLFRLARRYRAANRSLAAVARCGSLSAV